MKKMIRQSLKSSVAVIGITLAMLSPALSQANAAGGFVDSGITNIPGVYDGSIAWGDYNNDGYLDFAICGRSTEGLDFITRIYRNNGDGTFTDIGAGLPGVDFGSLAWGDYNNDGKLDLAVCGFLPSGERITRIYRNNGDGTFTDIGAGLPGVAYGSLAWGDFDNDGKLDLAISGYTGWDSGYTYITSLTRIYKNNGDGTFTDIGAGLPGVWDGSLAWGDYNNDGYLDLAISGTYGNTGTGSDFITRIYKNNGNGTFTDINAGLTGVTDSSIAWGDYNNDGKLDLAVGGFPYSKIYRNNGNNTFTDIKAELPMSVYGCSLGWGDYNNDGYLDLAICGRSDAGGFTKIYRNNGNGTFTDINAGIQGVCYSSLAWGDFDNDGDLDLAVCGSPNAGANAPYIAKIYKNLEADSIGNNNPNTQPSAPRNLTYEQDGAILLKWSPGSDEETPTNGLYYNLRVGTTPGNNDVVSGVYGSPLLGNYLRPKLSLGQLGVRLKNLPSGTYYWSVQTIDTGLQASKWSDEATFLVIPPPPVIISGFVKTASGTAISGVTVTFSNGAGSTTTDSTGYYSISIRYGWSGLATPLKSGYAFSPAYRSYSNVTGNQSNQNYTGNPLIIISGFVKTASGTAISGVTVTFSNGAGATTTDSTGYYSISIRYGWSGLATPLKSGYAFSPAYRSYSNVTGNQSNQNYTGNPLIIISGFVKTASGAAISGVTVIFSNGAGSTTTDSTGYYSISIRYGWSGLATPLKSGYTFSPAYRSYSNVTGNQSNQNYTGLIHIIPISKII